MLGHSLGRGWTQGHQRQALHTVGLVVHQARQNEAATGSLELTLNDR